MRNKKKKLITISITIIMFLIAGIIAFNYFSASKNINSNDDSNSPNSPKEEVQHVKFVDENSKSRPFAIMINNISTARPYQSGLQDAYIIYEMIAEGGITRFLALFKDQNTERIGSIRSSRHYYLDYVLENDAYYVHWGWSPQAQEDIKTLKINNINGLIYSNKYFWEDKSLDIPTEHRKFTSMDKLNQAVSDLKYRSETNKGLLFNYSVDEIELSKYENAKSANKIDINYSRSTTSSYKYDSEKKVYYRSVNDKPHVDYVTKEQYYFKNIITYQIKNSTIEGDDKGRQEFNNLGEGTGYFITNGYAVPIKWVKKDRESQTKYYFENGEELKVNDGNTFIQIQPVGQDLAIS